MLENNRNIEKNLKDSNHPLYADGVSQNSQSIPNKSDHSSVDSAKGLKENLNPIGFNLRKLLGNRSKKDSKFKLDKDNLENIVIVTQTPSSSHKNQKLSLEQKIKKDLDKNYQEVITGRNKSKKKILFQNKNDINKQKSNQSDYLVNNTINYNRNKIFKKLITIQISSIVLVTLNIILFLLLSKNKKISNLSLFVSSLLLSCISFGFTLFLIILLKFGIFLHYYTSNIFRFLCLINFSLSISLFIIQIILILNLTSIIDFELIERITKIFIYIIIFGKTSIIILLNMFIGIMAKESLLILIGFKNENACPERRSFKNRENKSGGNYVFFNEEADAIDFNQNTLRKFHACINFNN
jgi:hypothetical protein